MGIPVRTDYSDWVSEEWLMADVAYHSVRWRWAFIRVWIQRAKVTWYRNNSGKWWIIEYGVGYYVNVMGESITSLPLLERSWSPRMNRDDENKLRWCRQHNGLRTLMTSERDQCGHTVGMECMKLIGCNEIQWNEICTDGLACWEERINHSTTEERRHAAMYVDMIA